MTLFILNAYPLQLVQAEELKFKLSLDDEDCFLIIKNYSNESRNDKIESQEEVSVYGKYSEILYLNYSFTNTREFLQRQLEFRKEILEFIRHKKINRLVFGHYGNQVMKDLANKLGDKLDVIFIDEGIGTLNYYALREGKRNEKLPLKKVIRNFLTNFFFDFDNREVRNAVFFTAYDLKSSSNTKIIRNNYEVVKRATRIKETDDRVYVIGNPFVERKLLSMDDYHSFLKQVLTCYSDKEVVYLPHPYEQEALVNEIMKSFNIRLGKYNEPSLELHLLNSTTLPKALVTTVSTALLNSYYMFGEQLCYVSFKLEPQKWLYHSSGIDDIYKYYEGLQCEYFKVVEL